MNDASRPLSIYLVAAEESGDALGAALAGALTAGAEPVKLAGIGGRAMAATGIASPFPINALSIIGVSAIPRRLPTILRRIRESVDAIVAARPDGLVIIDSPDFTHRVARRVRARAPSIADPRLCVSRPSGRGARDALAPCAAMSIACSQSYRSSPRSMPASAARPASMSATR